MMMICMTVQATNCGGGGSQRCSAGKYVCIVLTLVGYAVVGDKDFMDINMDMEYQISTKVLPMDAI